jgi:hypothetical protein
MMNPCSFLRALPRLLCLCALLAAAPLWAADILWMHNGDRLSGKIEEMTDKMVRIKLPYGEPLTIARSAIMRWRLDNCRKCLAYDGQRRRQHQAQEQHQPEQ